MLELEYVFWLIISNLMTEEEPLQSGPPKKEFTLTEPVSTTIVALLIGRCATLAIYVPSSSMPCCPLSGKQQKRSCAIVKHHLFRGSMGATGTLPLTLSYSFLPHAVVVESHHHIDIRDNVGGLFGSVPEC